MHLQYRPEIDGLRAIAVIAVIFFHAKLSLFSGGFVGVDIFFVISGYLITSIILRQQKQKTFSLKNFYFKRARRILPALYFVTILTIPFAWGWMLPEDLVSHGGSILSIPYFVSNIFFWSEVSYFDSSAELKPLLHTWSLAVEEQYYLLFPAFLVITSRFSRRFQLTSLIGVSLLSLLLSEWGWRNAESANFYLAPTRAWEILVGSILAFFHYKPSIVKANMASISGFVMICVAIIFFEPDTPTPSLYSLLPITGTALVIMGATSGTVVNKLLSYKPMVFIGLISYSLYLFHQPILVFWKIRTQEELSHTNIIIFTLLITLLAYCSWKFIETPFRNPALISSKSILILTGIFTVFFSAFGVYVNTQNGVPNRLPETIYSLSEENSWNKHCLFQVSDGKAGSLPVAECTYNTNTEKTYAIWGDSISSALSSSLANHLLPSNIGLTQLTHGYCLPIPGLQRAHHQGSSNCIEFNNFALDFIIQNNIDTVILAANWNGVFNIQKLYFQEELITDKSKIINLYSSQLNKTVSILKARDIEVVILYPLVTSTIDVLRYVQQSQLFDKSWPTLERQKNDFIVESELSYQILDSINVDIKRIYPENVMCSDDVCQLTTEANIIIADKVHPTPYGADILADYIVNEISKLNNTNHLNNDQF